ncbi:MAG: D-alanine--D-alanine ligase [Terrimicrobiaceae bacterium]|nr:D-alanine--D-alanine ligase [Terrimicrobiaceae bacterium]
MKVAVLMGGPGSEREVSLRSGAAVVRALAALGAEPLTVEVKGRELGLPAGIHLAYNMIHGTFGEDGSLQEQLEAAGIPYTGDGPQASRAAFDKILTKEKFDANGVPTARWEIVRAGEAPRRPFPYVVKAPQQGSSVGVHIVRSPDEAPGALADCAAYGDRILVEDFFAGRELTVGILGGSLLPVVEIIPGEGFYDYRNKYTPGASRYEVPARLGEEANLAVGRAALAAWHALGLEVYCRVDILLAEDGSLNVMEANTIPGMTETSLLPKAAAAAGIGFPELCEIIAWLSLRRMKGGRG